MSVVEMRMLRWMSSTTIMDKIMNDHIRQKVHIAHIGEKMNEGRLRWFGHIKCKALNALV